MCRNIMSHEIGVDGRTDIIMPLPPIVGGRGVKNVAKHPGFRQTVRQFIEHCSLANEFLKNLATENAGRYLCVSQRHASDGAFNAHLFAHQLIESNFADPEVLVAS